MIPFRNRSASGNGIVVVAVEPPAEMGIALQVLSARGLELNVYLWPRYGALT
ncbi:MAG: hypothetical protein AAFV36_06100 [Myxococcota bacterium]